MKNDKRKMKNAIIFYPLLRGVASRFLGIVTGCVLFSFSLSAQTTNDFRLNQLSDSLPKGWEMEAQIQPFGVDDEPTLFLFISRIDSVKILAVNKINADKDYAEGLQQQARKEGKVTKLGLTLKLEPKWRKEKYNKVLAYDDSLDAIKKAMFEVYKIGELQKPHPLGKGQFVYDDSTPDKKQRLADYTNWVDRLNALKKPWPLYSSSNYSVFFYPDYQAAAFREIYPPSAESEEFEVIQLIERILKSDY